MPLRAGGKKKPERMRTISGVPAAMKPRQSVVAKIREKTMGVRDRINEQMQNQSDNSMVVDIAQKYYTHFSP